MYISLIDFQWTNAETKSFHKFKKIIQHLIMITCIIYENIFVISVSECINIAPL